MSPAAGRAAAELIHYGAFQTLDLGIFGFARFVDRSNKNTPVVEVGIV